MKELQLSKTSLSELETTLENLQLTSDDTTRGLRQEVNINIYICILLNNSNDEYMNVYISYQKLRVYTSSPT